MAAQAMVVALHLAPGVLAYFLLRTARQPLERSLGLTSAEVQIGLVMTSVMLLMGAATFVCARLLDEIGPGAVLRLTGVTRVDPVGLLLAVVMSLVVLAVPSILGYEDDLRRLVEGVDWLALPSWHFQRTDGFTQIPPLIAGVAVVANLVGEELWFRGYLQDKLHFLGRFSWMGAGMLFTLYHVFEAPVVYPGFLGALALAGLWALRRDLWSCILLHALLNASL